ncbi:MAG: hypothetical protein N2039_12460, partial [Gemmataceae bacterium]|nr:hypothetical protein [Gemmataceae bacterium]
MQRLPVLLLILVIAGNSSADPRATFSRAKTPDNRELNRANLALTWTISLPMLGTRDGIATVQLLPVPDPVQKGEDRVLLVVQLRSGTLAVYDA